ncbi:MAG TPA: DNA ligase D [Rudaea sp.]|jgi:bifunctional non-homologous end joining protein LigD|uniref:DNA ligase D n=1 Tax=Rudaea sp. TaxID=2136325 RepID=UPI002F950FA4
MAKGKLSEYSAKRTFEVTPEPAPTVAEAQGGPLLFVVQQHSARRLHYDFRLECDGVLKSWAVPKGPSVDRNEKRLAVHVEDHPYDYGSFEGVIPPKQYGAGEVIVWDCGVYSPDEGGTWFHDRARAEKEVREGIAKGKLSFLLRGEKLKGSFALVRTKDAKTWLLIKHKDRFVSTDDVTAQNRSVLSGAAVEDLKIVPAHRIPAAQLVPAGDVVAMPTKLAPMQAETGESAFNHADWMWEPKLDGYRVLAFIDAKGVKLRSRNGLDLTRAFPKLVDELAKQSVDGMILDGEIVAFDAAGKPSFNALQNRVQLKTEREIAAVESSTPVMFYAFDLLYFAGIDLRAARYGDRRRYLAQCLLPSQHVQLVHASADGNELNAAALASGFEGVIGKRKDSRYEAGKRSAAWLKIKPTQTGDFVVGGYTTGTGSRAALGALLLGYWDRKKLRYASHVGSGFTDKTLKQVKAKLDPLKRKTCPFAEKPETNGPVTWVEPTTVVEVNFQSWTDDGSLRAPIFLRLRDDLDAKSVRRVEAGASASAPAPKRATGAIADVMTQLENRKLAFTLAVGKDQIKLTHLDRVYWPADPSLRQAALTKRDLLRYLAQVSPYMLPHLAARPLTMIRMPDGITKQRFFQKHWEQERPDFVETITVFSGHKDERHEYLVCNTLSTLLWLAQSGTLEFHIWHSRAQLGSDAASSSTDYATSLESLEASVLNYPDYVVFDIDPYIYSGKEAKGAEPELNTVAFEKGKEVAFWLRELLQSMSLDAIVKTSGKTGLHVFVPIRRTIDFDAARHVSELVGRHLMRLHPKDITMEWSVPKRTGKIFMDYNMNVRGKTLNVAYSPRGEPGAPISMPLTWEELAKAHPLDFRLTNVIEKLTQSGDRWLNALKNKQNLEKALAGKKA